MAWDGTRSKDARTDRPDQQTRAATRPAPRSAVNETTTEDEAAPVRRPAEGRAELEGAAVVLALAARCAATEATEAAEAADDADARETDATDAVLSAAAIETEAALTWARCDVCEAMNWFASCVF